ncbi:hypothetical protein SLA2020_124410 [Shorea laevis]
MMSLLFTTSPPATFATNSKPHHSMTSLLAPILSRLGFNELATVAPALSDLQTPTALWPGPDLSCSSRLQIPSSVRAPPTRSCRFYENKCFQVSLSFFLSFFFFFGMYDYGNAYLQRSNGIWCISTGMITPSSLFSIDYLRKLAFGSKIDTISTGHYITKHLDLEKNYFHSIVEAS